MSGEGGRVEVASLAGGDVGVVRVGLVEVSIMLYRVGKGPVFGYSPVFEVFVAVGAGHVPIDELRVV